MPVKSASVPWCSNEQRADGQPVPIRPHVHRHHRSSERGPGRDVARVAGPREAAVARCRARPARAPRGRPPPTRTRDGGRRSATRTGCGTRRRRCRHAVSTASRIFSPTWSRGRSSSGPVHPACLVQHAAALLVAKGLEGDARVARDHFVAGLAQPVRGAGHRIVHGGHGLREKRIVERDHREPFVPRRRPLHRSPLHGCAEPLHGPGTRPRTERPRPPRGSRRTPPCRTWARAGVTPYVESSPVLGLKAAMPQ